ncbi:hypothetical protein ACFX12_013604 [Malus domestica]
MRGLGSDACKLGCHGLGRGFGDVSLGWHGSGRGESTMDLATVVVPMVETRGGGATHLLSHLASRIFLCESLLRVSISALNESTNLWMQIFSSSILDDFAPTKQLAP